MHILLGKYLTVSNRLIVLFCIYLTYWLFVNIHVISIINKYDAVVSQINKSNLFEFNIQQKQYLPILHNSRFLNS